MAELVPDDEYFAGGKTPKFLTNSNTKHLGHTQAIDSLDLHSPLDNNIVPPGLSDNRRHSKLFNMENPSFDDASFVKNNQHGWNHGAAYPYSVFKYHRVKTSNPNYIYNAKDANTVLSPSIALEEANNGSIQLGLTSDSSSEFIPLCDDDHDDSADEAETRRNYFSGFFSAPACAINYPSRANTTINESPSSLGSVCYQNHFDVDDLTFTFGGLVTDSNINLKMLGLPRDANPDKISVQFNCEVPPFIDEKILTSPYLVQNPALYLFNPVRGTVTFLNKDYDLGDSPTHYNAMTSTQISYRHVFFYGGFAINVDSSYFDPVCQRWIVKKRLVLNEDGYIFDIITYSFKKIILKTREDAAVELNLGRVGNAIVSNKYEKLQMYSPDTFDRAPLPPIFSEEVASTSPQSPSSPITKSAPPKLNAPVSKIVRPVPGSPSAPQSATSNTAPSSIVTDANNSQEDVVSTPTLTSGAASFLIKNKVTRSGTNDSSATSNSSSSKSNVAQVKTNNSSSSSSSVGSSKMSNVLSKSTRLFHRNHQRQPSAQNGKQKESSNSSHPLKNTYSKQVKQRRSNSNTSSQGSSTLNPVASRSDSPVYSYQKSALSQVTKKGSEKKEELVTENLTFENMTNPKKNESPFYSNQQFIPTYTMAKTETNMETPPSSAGSAPGGAPSAPPAVSTYPLANVSPVVEAIDSDSQSLVDSMDSRAKESVFTEPIEKGGILTVSIFIFGGFTCHLDPDDPHFKVFKASSDLLKIELVLQEGSRSNTFLDDAYVFLLGNDEKTSDFWPSARGYFASALVEESGSFEAYAKAASVESSLAGSFRPSSPFSNNSNSDRSSYQNLKNNFDLTNNHLASDILKHRSHMTYFGRKVLVIQGGVDDNATVYSDFYVFSFSTGKWSEVLTYAYDYYQTPKAPYDDENSSLLTLENQTLDPKLVEAELRACHHSCLSYQNEEHDYLLFVGGFTNDYLRHFELTPYKSDKFDVSRLSKFSFVSTNDDNLSRVLALNLQTQTWLFLKVTFDTKHFIAEKEMKRLKSDPIWENARIINYGGAFSLNGKMLTICHGLCKIVPEKREDFAKMNQLLPASGILWGCHVHMVFPGI